VDTNIIVCIDHAAIFEFTNVTHIHISKVRFLGCGGNRAESVMNFSLINIVFDGQNQHYAIYSGADPEILHGRWLMGWLPIVNYNGVRGVAG
jgi:hypothetical protein